ncbi:protein disulfide isomerase, variant [Thecamonas trahens ATCC 50062]|uniref:Protein disulfide isomerase, variant n=1 Tax=Thecamonas trahens ATCC 50062 TaxID=461836 RepID=A0A0L0D0Y9_THETB|nr:protein disulfide isomerase, variant [Thecamonas trahens ATCC 50062]KNC46044.1 protein disulfide isomerase, variant [Thecamonas trahens ATCC 50062]|eukprot:XP_013763025.1 protein disulfide isomerase, variant [Thecamonas trahens ATCC 50062]
MQVQTVVFVVATVVAVLSSTVAGASIFPQDGPVRVLTSAKEVDNFVSTVPAAMVMIYAPWCSHCTAFKPAFIQAAGDVADAGLGAFAAVNGDEHRDVIAAYSIKSFPTVLYFADGELKWPYSGPRSAAGLLAYMENPVAPPPPPQPTPLTADGNGDVVILATSNYSSVLLSSPSTFVMLYSPSCGHCKNTIPHFMDAASAALDDDSLPLFAAVDLSLPENGAIGKMLDVAAFPTFVLFDGNIERFRYKGARTKAAFLEWVADPQAPPPPPPPPARAPFTEDGDGDVAMLSPETFDDHLDGFDGTLVMFFAPWCGHCKAMKEPYKAAAATVKAEGLGSLAAVDCTVDNSLCNEFNIKGYPTLIYFGDDDEQITFAGVRSEEGLVAFMRDPQPPPPPPPPPTRTPFTEDGDGDVTMLTPETFDDHLDGSDGTLVMFYAPWCGHCKTMKEPYKAAAATVKAEGLGSLAAVDCTIDRALCGKHDVKGYPTVVYFGADDEQITFAGVRSEEGLVAFMRDPQPPPPPPPPPTRTPFTEDGDGDVTMLTPETFDDHLDGSDGTLVMFYAPWCGHCKAMKEPYKAAAATVKAEGLGSLAAVDCTIDGDLCARHSANAYPTLLHFTDASSSIKYEASRTEDALLEFMREHSSPVDHDEL